MTNINIKPVDSFPTITRSRASVELQKIIDSLVMSANTGQIFSIDNVEAGNAYNSMQQRIRTQAKKHNLKVMISFDKSNNTLYYKASWMSREKVAVKPVGVTESFDVESELLSQDDESTEMIENTVDDTVVEEVVEKKTSRSRSSK